MATLLLCMSLLSGCAITKLTHPETGAEIQCYKHRRITIGDVPDYDLLSSPVVAAHPADWVVVQPRRRVLSILHR